MKMRRVLTALLASVVMALVAAPQSFGLNRYGNGQDMPERDEMRQVFELSSGTRVAVENINGRVEIETHPGDTAEVHVIRSARTREELNYRKVIASHTAEGLLIRGEDDRGQRNVRVNQHVMLKLPRQISLSLNDINGHTTVGEIEGPVHISDINGGLEVAQAAEYAEISDVNGGLALGITRLGSRGVRLTDINGGVELRFAEDLNADLNVRDMNGGLHGDMTANMVVEGKIERSNFRARIGNGGIPISVTDINGGLRLARARSTSR